MKHSLQFMCVPAAIAISLFFAIAKGEDKASDEERLGQQCQRIADDWTFSKRDTNARIGAGDKRLLTMVLHVDAKFHDVVKFYADKCGYKEDRLPIIAGKATEDEGYLIRDCTGADTIYAHNPRRIFVYRCETHTVSAIVSKPTREFKFTEVDVTICIH